MKIMRRPTGVVLEKMAQEKSASGRPSEVALLVQLHREVCSQLLYVHHRGLEALCLGDPLRNPPPVGMAVCTVLVRHLKRMDTRLQPVQVRSIDVDPEA